VTVAPRRLWRLAPLLLLLCAWLSACSVGGDENKTLELVTIFPTTGPDGAVGLALQQAVTLAVKQNNSLGGGYSLGMLNIDEGSALRDTAFETALENPQVIGFVGPYSSGTALAFLPESASAGVVMVSPTATLTGLTQSDAAASEHVPFESLHPAGKPPTFFRLAPTDDALGKAGADLAVAPKSKKGLAAHTVFLVDDASASGKAAAAAFATELKAKGGVVAGQQSLTTGAYDNSQLVVRAVIRADADLVFYAGGLVAGAALRSTLTLTGAPNTPILAAGPVADNPGWSETVGQPLVASHTIGILPAADLGQLDSAKAFVSAWQAGYGGSGKAALPQAALAYDAAMAEITAIKSVISAGKSPTRSAIATALATTKFGGATGAIAFDQHGDSTAAPTLSVYSCTTKGTWSLQTVLQGAGAG
jgi:branched-chain amino acid transport system substrate-binding protein